MLPHCKARHVIWMSHVTLAQRGECAGLN